MNRHQKLMYTLVIVSFINMIAIIANIANAIFYYIKGNQLYILNISVAVLMIIVTAWNIKDQINSIKKMNDKINKRAKDEAI